MKVIDLTRASKHKKNQSIKEYCGGLTLETRWLMRFEKGISGFTFTDPEIPDTSQKYVATMAFYKEGLGIYCRNMFANYLILIHQDDIRSIEIEKRHDIIRPTTFSFYKILRYLGASEFTSSKYLMPKEIIEEHKAKFILRCTEKYITLELDKLPYHKLISVFKKSTFVDKLNVNVQSVKIKHVHA